MTIIELQIILNLNKGNERALLEEHACLTEYSYLRVRDYGYFFVDSEDGQCWLLDQNGQLDDIKKIDVIYESYIKKDIKKIVIPNSVKRIGDWTFYNHNFLTSIEIPNSVKIIGDFAFYGCNSLANIKIPDSAKSIGDVAFRNCTSLKSIDIPGNVKSIGNSAFADCASLKSIEILNSIKSIGYGAFENCRSLTSVIFKCKTIDQVKAMNEYPWGIEDEAIIKCQKS